MCYSAGLEEDDYKWLYEKDKRDYAQIILDRLKKERDEKMSSEWIIIKGEEERTIELHHVDREIIAEWITISRWGKDRVLVNASSNCLVPIDCMKKFLEELQKFIEEIEEEVAK